MRRIAVTALAGLGLGCATVEPAAAPGARSEAPVPAAAAGEAAPAGSALPGGVQAQIAAREYWASESGGGLQAPNRRHGLRTWFEPSGIRVHDRVAGGSPRLVELRLSRVGRGAALSAVSPGVVTSREGRVEIRREGLVEWFLNSPQGLEQGFALEDRPAPDAAGELVLELEVSGARVGARGEAIALASNAGRTLAYGKLEAADAQGRALEARLEAPARDRIRLVVEDAQATYPLTIDPLLEGTADAQLESNQSGPNFGWAQLGWSVASAGDVNGDGYDDVIVGAPYYDAGVTDEGAAFVFLGSANGIADGNPSTAHAQIEGDLLGALLGLSVASAGDVNGDGYGDVIVGVPSFAWGSGYGFAGVWLGSANGITGGGPASSDWWIFGDGSSESFGNSVAPAGDVNGDGYGDVIVGDPGYDAPYYDEGAAFVFLGYAVVSGDSTNPVLAHAQLEANSSYALLGLSVASAGDVNADGYADVIVGAPHYGSLNEGAAFVFLGSASGIADGNPATAHAQLESNQGNAELGIGVAPAGDVNGDGYGDVIVGAPLFDAGETDEGAAFVFLGSASGIADGNPATAHAQLESDQINAQLGIGVAPAGDVNGDGYGDVIAGADHYDAGETDEGAAFVFHGSASGIPDGTPATAAARLESNQAAAQLGHGVAGAGNVNGDGYADVIVGAPTFDAGQTNEGAAFVFHGGARGIEDGNPATAAQLEPDQASAQLAYSVAPAGDVNGDGYGDVIVGAPLFDAGETDEGAAFVFQGTASGIPDTAAASAATQLEANQAGAGLGQAVAAAGDVNGDGYGDVIVGAYLYDAGETDEGAAFIFHGDAGGIPDGSPATAATQLESNQAAAQLGHGVAGAGDVNGDGFGDVVVGAYLYDGGEANEGAAWVFHGRGVGIADGNPATAASAFESNLAQARLGLAVSGAGDVNGDGYGDVLLGAYRYSAGESEEGAAFLLPGSETGVPSGNPATLGVTRLESNQASARLGRSVASAGDVNGDGYADVIAGAYLYDAGESNEGAAFVFHGSSSGIADGNPTTANAQLESDQASAQLGFSVGGAGDANGDGYGDVIAGANLYDAGETDEGAAFVFQGSASGVADGNPQTAMTQLESNQASANFGSTVASAGDVNGDGYGDVIAGADHYDAGETDEGAAFVFLSNSQGRPVLAQQRGVYGAASLSQPWGYALGTAFQAELRGSHPDGVGRVREEVEACPPGVAFGDLSCTSAVGTAWESLALGAADTSLKATLVGLSPDTLYRWRARVQHAPSTGPLPANPPHGPWRRVGAQASEGDIRPVPEPDELLGLGSTLALLVALYRRRMRAVAPRLGTGLGRPAARGR